MNLTSLITLPARLGYEATRRTLDVAAGAGRRLGLFGDGAEPATQPESTAARRPTRPKPDMDDATLARKVESEIFRVRGVAKGKIDVNAAGGVVWLRGEAKTPELIKRIEARAKAVPEVKEVENLLHLPKTPAPSRTDTPPSQRRTRSGSDRTAAKATKAKAARSTAARRAGGAPKRTTEEKPVAPAEPAPARLAARDEGRQPAPLGSNPDVIEEQVPDDVTLARMVESEIFTGDAVEKGSINVNAADGRVWLRGVARDPDQIRELERRALAVPGVKKVENLLHMPGTPAQTAERAPTPPEEREVTRRFTTAEEPGAGEPLPSELAERGEGRQPAPLGSRDDSDG